jgi:hypothetical protein
VGSAMIIAGDILAAIIIAMLLLLGGSVLDL